MSSQPEKKPFNLSSFLQDISRETGQATEYGIRALTNPKKLNNLQKKHETQDLRDIKNQTLMTIPDTIKTKEKLLKSTANQIIANAKDLTPQQKIEYQQKFDNLNLAKSQWGTKQLSQLNQLEIENPTKKQQAILKAKHEAGLDTKPQQDNLNKIKNLQQFSIFNPQSIQSLNPALQSTVDSTGKMFQQNAGKLKQLITPNRGLDPLRASQITDEGQRNLDYLYQTGQIPDNLYQQAKKQFPQTINKAKQQYESNSQAFQDKQNHFTEERKILDNLDNPANPHVQKHIAKINQVIAEGNNPSLLNEGQNIYENRGNIQKLAEGFTQALPEVVPSLIPATNFASKVPIIAKGISRISSPFVQNVVKDVAENIGQEAIISGVSEIEKLANKVHTPEQALAQGAFNIAGAGILGGALSSAIHAPKLATEIENKNRLNFVNKTRAERKAEQAVEGMSITENPNTPQANTINLQNNPLASILSGIEPSKSNKSTQSKIAPNRQPIIKTIKKNINRVRDLEGFREAIQNNTIPHTTLEPHEQSVLLSEIEAELVGRALSGKMPQQSRKAVLNFEDNIQSSQPQSKLPTQQANTQGQRITKAKTETGNEIETEFEIKDIRELNASHEYKGSQLIENPNYPQELQPRDRERMASNVQIDNMSNNLDPELLGYNIKASDGSPIIGADNIVESGNARSIAIKKAYNNNKANHYRQYLLDNAQAFGLKPEEIAKLQDPNFQPILVRKRLTDIDRKQFTKEANKSSVAQSSPAELAKNDSNLLDDKIIQQLESGKDIANNSNIAGEFYSKLPISEKAQYFTEDGRLNKLGEDRLRNALLMKTFGKTKQSQKILTQAIETDDFEVKNGIRAITNATPDFAIIQERIAQGEIPQEYDITDYFTNAINKLDQIRKANARIEDLIHQTNLFGDKFSLSNFDKFLLKQFHDLGRSPNKLATILKTYAQTVDEQIQSSQLTLMPIEPKSPLKILEESFRDKTDLDDTDIFLLDEAVKNNELNAKINTNEKQALPNTERDIERLQDDGGLEIRERQTATQSMDEEGQISPSTKSTRESTSRSDNTDVSNRQDTERPSTKQDITESENKQIQEAENLEKSENAQRNRPDDDKQYDNGRPTTNDDRPDNRQSIRRPLNKQELSSTYEEIFNLPREQAIATAEIADTIIEQIYKRSKANPSISKYTSKEDIYKSISYKKGDNQDIAVKTQTAQDIAKTTDKIINLTGKETIQDLKQLLISSKTKWTTEAVTEQDLKNANKTTLIKYIKINNENIRQGINGNLTQSYSGRNHTHKHVQEDIDKAIEAKEIEILQELGYKDAKAFMKEAKTLKGKQRQDFDNKLEEISQKWKELHNSKYQGFIDSTEIDEVMADKKKLWLSLIETFPKKEKGVKMNKEIDKTPQGYLKTATTTQQVKENIRQYLAQYSKYPSFAGANVAEYLNTLPIDLVKKLMSDNDIKSTDELETWLQKQYPQARKLYAQETIQARNESNELFKALRDERKTRPKAGSVDYILEHGKRANQEMIAKIEAIDNLPKEKQNLNSNNPAKTTDKIINLTGKETIQDLKQLLINSKAKWTTEAITEQNLKNTNKSTLIQYVKINNENIRQGINGNLTQSYSGRNHTHKHVQEDIDKTIEAKETEILQELGYKDAKAFMEEAKALKGKQRQDFDNKLEEISKKWQELHNSKYQGFIDSTEIDEAIADKKKLWSSLFAILPKKEKQNLNSNNPDIRHQQTKGMIELYEDGRAIIHALQDPNLTTPLHELSHVYERVLTKSERQSILEWANKSFKKQKKEWDEDVSEMFATGFEKYLSEGKAPSSRMENIFKRFQDWLMDIYNNLIKAHTSEGEIPITLNTRMREIYTDMLGESPQLGTKNLKPQADIFGITQRTTLNRISGKYWNELMRDPDRFGDWDKAVKDFNIDIDPKIKEQINKDISITAKYTHELKQSQKNTEALFNALRKANPNKEVYSFVYNNQEYNIPLTQKNERVLSTKGQGVLNTLDEILHKQDRLEYEIGPSKPNTLKIQARSSTKANIEIPSNSDSIAYMLMKEAEEHIKLSTKQKISRDILKEQFEDLGLLDQNSPYHNMAFRDNDSQAVFSFSRPQSKKLYKPPTLENKVKNAQDKLLDNDKTSYIKDTESMDTKIANIKNPNQASLKKNLGLDGRTKEGKINIQDIKNEIEAERLAEDIITNNKSITTQAQAQAIAKTYGQGKLFSINPLGSILASSPDVLTGGLSLADNFYNYALKLVNKTFKDTTPKQAEGKLIASKVLGQLAEIADLAIGNISNIRTKLEKSSSPLIKDFIKEYDKLAGVEAQSMAYFRSQSTPELLDKYHALKEKYGTLGEVQKAIRDGEIETLNIDESQLIINLTTLWGKKNKLIRDTIKKIELITKSKEISAQDKKPYTHIRDLNTLYELQNLTNKQHIHPAVSTMQNLSTMIALYNNISSLPAVLTDPLMKGILKGHSYSHILSAYHEVVSPTFRKSNLFKAFNAKDQGIYISTSSEWLENIRNKSDLFTLSTQLTNDMMLLQQAKEFNKRWKAKTGKNIDIVKSFDGFSDSSLEFSFYYNNRIGDMTGITTNELDKFTLQQSTYRPFLILLSEPMRYANLIRKNLDRAMKGDTESMKILTGYLITGTLLGGSAFLGGAGGGIGILYNATLRSLPAEERDKLEETINILNISHKLNLNLGTKLKTSLLDTSEKNNIEEIVGALKDGDIGKILAVSELQTLGKNLDKAYKEIQTHDISIWTPVIAGLLTAKALALSTGAGRSVDKLLNKLNITDDTTNKVWVKNGGQLKDVDKAPDIADIFGESVNAGYIKKYYKYRNEAIEETLKGNTDKANSAKKVMYKYISKVPEFSNGVITQDEIEKGLETSIAKKRNSREKAINKLGRINKGETLLALDHDEVRNKYASLYKSGKKEQVEQAFAEAESILKQKGATKKLNSLYKDRQAVLGYQ